MSVFKSVKAYVGISDDVVIGDFAQVEAELEQLNSQSAEPQLSFEDPVASMHEKLKVLPDAQAFADVDFRPDTKVVTPRSFAAAKLVADHYNSGDAVFLNLTGVDHSLGLRLLDFCSGVCYSTDGKMQKIRRRLFLITPSGTSLSRRELEQARREVGTQ